MDAQMDYSNAEKSTNNKFNVTEIKFARTEKFTDYGEELFVWNSKDNIIKIERVYVYIPFRNKPVVGLTNCYEHCAIKRDENQTELF